MSKQYTLSYANRSLLNIARVLIGVSVFLAIFVYKDKIVLSFLFVSLFLLLINQIIFIIISKIQHRALIYQDCNQDTLVNTIIFDHESLDNVNKLETYLIIDLSNDNIFKTQNIASIINRGNNRFTVNFKQPINKPFELETAGLSKDEVKVRVTHCNVRFNQQPEGLIIIKIICDKSL
ncbi:MAG: hypothetical protein KBD64_03755 [Gammaproteobacteria bacterium]|nr:hypothetical protein [Gammaproteobacteria bacterium]